MITLARQDVLLNDVGVSWPHWARDNSPVDRIVMISGTEVHGWRTPRQIAGIATAPAPQVLGLHAWDDAREGLAIGTPWVIFDIEKLIRMLLRQSPLAYRVLASHLCAVDIAPIDREFILNAAVTQQLVRNIGLEAKNTIATTHRRDDVLGILAELAAGWALARGHVDLHAAAVLGTHPEWNDLDLESDADLRRAILSLSDELLSLEAPLPERPADYDGLSTWLVNRRLQTVS